MAHGFSRNLIPAKLSENKVTYSEQSWPSLVFVSFRCSDCSQSPMYFSWDRQDRAFCVTGGQLDFKCTESNQETFSSWRDVYVDINVTMATELWQRCFSKFAFFVQNVLFPSLIYIFYYYITLNLVLLFQICCKCKPGFLETNLKMAKCQMLVSIQ